MTRWGVASGLLKFIAAQLAHLLRISLTLVQPSFPDKLELAFSRYLAALANPFDQSSSNYILGQSSSTQQNALIEHLCSMAAHIYGAPFARLSLGGSSKSIHQTIGHIIPRARPGKNILLLDPACHKSVFAGLIESGLEVVYLQRSFSDEHRLVGPIDERHFHACLSKFRSQIAAVLITHPTYEGYGSNLYGISEACRDADTLLCIDGAWGSNFGLVSGLPEFPIAKADIVITSPHKKGAAPSQVGLVLFKDDRLANLYDEASRAGCETTSPNWNLLVLFEHRLAEISSGNWNTAWLRAIEEANIFRRRIPDIDPNLDCPEPHSMGFEFWDPTHVYINTSTARLSGTDLAHALSTHFHIDAEMSGPNGILFLFGPAHDGQSEKLARAIERALTYVERKNDLQLWRSPQKHVSSAFEVLKPRSAYFASSQIEELNSCAGRTSASLIYAYPPGIPLLAYGERITEEHIAIIEQLAAAGTSVSGLQAGQCIRVTRAPPRLPALTNSQTTRNKSQPTMNEQPEALKLTIHGYPFGEAPTEIINEVAQLFREIFCNPPYNQFAARLNDPATPLSFSDMAPAGYAATSDYQSLDLLDAVKLPDGFFRWMEPGEFEDRFRAKANQLYITTGREQESAQLKAFIVCRVLTVRELFYTEEFRNPIYFSGREFLRRLRSPSKFYRLMDHHFGLVPDDEIFYTVGMGAHPSARGSNFLFPGMNAICDQVSTAHGLLPSLGEVAASGPGRIHSEAVHDRVIHGILENDHALIHANHLKDVIARYRAGPSHIRDLVKTQAKVARTGYAPHPNDHPGVELRETISKGTGVFATRDIQPGEMIAEFVGETYTAALESQLPPIMVDRCIQTGPTTYVFAENRLAEKINHSCQPNCGVREKTKIVAIQPIMEGEEICWDYRMSENSDWVLEACSCGAERCAGRVEGYDSLPEDTKLEYLKKGAVSSWLLDRQ